MAARLILSAVLVLAAALRLWRLDQNGFGNECYSPRSSRPWSRRERLAIMLGDLSVVSRRLGAETAGRPIAEWTRQNGAPVDPALWREHGRGSSLQLYDLRPEAGVTARAAPRESSE